MRRTAAAAADRTAEDIAQALPDGAAVETRLGHTVYAEDARFAHVIAAIDAAATDVRVIILTCRESAFAGPPAVRLTPLGFGPRGRGLGLAFSRH